MSVIRRRLSPAPFGRGPRIPIKSTMKKILLSCATLLLATATVALAADPAAKPDRAPPGAGGGNHHRRPPHHPTMVALDTNHDGELSAQEIAQAPKSLLTLDVNGDGKLDREELRPPRPEGEARPEGPPPQDD